MSSEIKNKCFLGKQVQVEKVEKVEVKEVEKVKPVEIEKKLNYTSNKLISCYEEDYTRNITEIMKLWQRN
jgi:hypothetical protein